MHQLAGETGCHVEAASHVAILSVLVDLAVGAGAGGGQRHALADLDQRRIALVRLMRRQHVVVGRHHRQVGRARGHHPQRPRGQRVAVYDVDGYYVGPGIAELLAAEGARVVVNDVGAALDGSGKEMSAKKTPDQSRSDGRKMKNSVLMGGRALLGRKPRIWGAADSRLYGNAKTTGRRIFGG